MLLLPTLEGGIASACQQRSLSKRRLKVDAGGYMRLTVKVRGRTTTADKPRGRTLSAGARGAKPLTHHGPSNDC